MTSIAIDKIQKSSLPSDGKKRLSTYLLALQSLTMSSLEDYTRLSDKIPSILSDKNYTEKQKSAWTSYNLSLCSRYESDKRKMDDLATEINDTVDLNTLLSKYSNI